MKKLLTICSFFLMFHSSLGSVFLWSNKKVEFPSLQLFTDESLQNILSELSNPQVVFFQGKIQQTQTGFLKELKDMYSAYIPSSMLNLENETLLTNPNKIDPEDIQRQLKEGNDYIALMVEGNRFKRAATTEPSKDETPKGVLFTNKEVMIYSAQPPLLTINNDSVLLEKASSVTVDKRDIVRVSVNVPVGEVKYNLKFKFYWQSGYWYFLNLEVMGTDSKTYNLTSNRVISAAKRFSYHCGGTTRFSNDDSISIEFYNFQVQLDAINTKFDDAYDCVHFTTPAIWSGLFVSFMLLIVLTLGIAALGSIKTMDKFDNSKTKQLNITVSE